MPTSNLLQPCPEVRLLLTSAQARIALQIGERLLGELTRRGNIKAIRVGGCGLTARHPLSRGRAAPMD